MKFDTTILHPKLEEMAAYAQAAEAFVRQQLAFYMSTPAYRTVLTLHGWEETSNQLGELARQGQWDNMAALITDEMLETFAVSGPWPELPGQIEQRYGRLLDRVSYYFPFIPGENEGHWRASITGFKERFQHKELIHEGYEGH